MIGDAVFEEKPGWRGARRKHPRYPRALKLYSVMACLSKPLVDSSSSQKAFSSREPIRALRVISGLLAIAGLGSERSESALIWQSEAVREGRKVVVIEEASSVQTQTAGPTSIWKELELNRLRE